MSKGEIVGKTLLGVFVGGVIKIVTQLLVTLLGALLFWLLYKIPIIRGIVNFLFAKRGDSPSSFIIVVSLVIAYIMMSYVMSKVCGDIQPFSYAMIVIGIIVLIIHITSLVINMINGDAVIANVWSIIFGAMIIFRREEMFD